MVPLFSRADPTSNFRPVNALAVALDSMLDQGRTAYGRSPVVADGVAENSGGCDRRAKPTTDGSVLFSRNPRKSRILG